MTILTNTLKKIILYPYRLLNRNIYKKQFSNSVLSIDELEGRFTQIYKGNYWGNKESVSGSGSTLNATNSLRESLPELIEKFKVSRIFDGPCGDFLWMNEFLKNTSLHYIGGDIVREMIKKHCEKYGDDEIRFIHIDLVSQAHPTADLMICRDCLFHLSYHDALKLLKNYLKSETPYILTSTHRRKTAFRNSDITSGDFRLIDLFSPPFNFPKEVHFRFLDGSNGGTDKEMCMWSRAQIEYAVKLMSSEIDELLLIDAKRLA